MTEEERICVDRLRADYKQESSEHDLTLKALDAEMTRRELAERAIGELEMVMNDLKSWVCDRRLVSGAHSLECRACLATTALQWLYDQRHLQRLRDHENRNPRPHDGIGFEADRRQLVAAERVIEALKNDPCRDLPISVCEAVWAYDATRTSKKKV